MFLCIFNSAIFLISNLKSTPMDRLSGLPDDVIIHILSFLPTKTSASTDVLARRWRFLWTHVPNLHFDEECQDPAVIDRVIALHRANIINSLSLGCYTDNWRQDQLATWIIHALNRGVRNLYFYGRIDDTFTLPEYLFTCKTLVDVSLYECRGISSRDKVFLPSLKKLYLSFIICDDNNTLPHLISGCPVLQDLIIEGFYGWDRVLVVSSLTIKYLEVDLDVFLDNCEKVVLKIKAPSLQYLKLRNFYSDKITISSTMTSLIEAHISSVEICHCENEFSAARFLNCLCNSEYLSISIDEECDQVVNIVGLDSMVKFHNLTKLELRLMFDFHELIEFLEAADNLKHLTFTLGRKPNTYREPKLVPKCMLSCLKTVRINPLKGFNAHDFESVGYVLRNAQLMERMEIYSSTLDSSCKEELELLGRIPLLERGFESCQIIFC